MILISPDGTATDGTARFVGVHVVLSPAQAQSGVKVNGYALKFHVLTSKPGFFHGAYKAPDGWDQTSQFYIKDNVLYTSVVEGVSRPPREMLAWGRVQCPR